MTVKSRILARLLAVTVLFAAMIAGGAPSASALTTHRALNDTRAAGAAPVTVDFPIEYFGVVGDLPTPDAHLSAGGATPYGQARFHVNGQWTPWQDIEEDGAQAPGRFTGALMSVDRADAYQVRGLPSGAHGWRAAAINTTDGPTVEIGRAPDAAAHAAPRCMSRADWGADESISGWSHGLTQTYYPVQTLTVHHTAGSNVLSQDYSATVRAIYSYHVQTNGWEDIGYQYLIDGYGTVYEGRNSGHTSVSCLTEGGDGRDFAHQSTTDYMVTGAHVADMNSGNLGIALMGCFESNRGACRRSPAPTPSAAAVDGLEGLLASLSSRHNLNPIGQTHFVNPVSGATKDVATISAHRDWQSTECPGGNLYSQLPTIRSNVASRMEAPATAASITSASCSTATCSFTGVGAGTLTWSFGDGTAASGPQVATTYRSAGTYTVTLTDSQQPPSQATRTVSCAVQKRALCCTT